MGHLPRCHQDRIFQVLLLLGLRLDRHRFALVRQQNYRFRFSLKIGMGVDRFVCLCIGEIGEKRFLGFGRAPNAVDGVM